MLTAGARDVPGGMSRAGRDVSDTGPGRGAPWGMGRGGADVISEPEMSETGGGGLPGDPLGDSGDPAPERAPAQTAAADPKGRPWVWVAGAVVATSALWAAALPIGEGGARPDLHGYHLSGNPCGGDVLAALEDAVGAPGFAASDATVSRGPALDKASCVLSGQAPDGGGWATNYTLSVSVELHKRTDPRPEFEDTRRAQVSTLPGGSHGSGVLVAVAESGYSSARDVRPVTGVGDDAYLLEPRASDQILKVLHGGAVLTLQVSGYSGWNGPGTSSADSGTPPPEPDLTRLRPALTTAMRHLMTTLAS